MPADILSHAYCEDTTAATARFFITCYRQELYFISADPWSLFKSDDLNTLCN